MEPQDRPGADIEVVDELRFLAESLRRIDAATATAHFDDEDAMARIVAEAHAELTLARDAAVEDIGAAGASAAWRARAVDHEWAVTQAWDSPPSKPAGQARADAVVAIALARAAVAEAVLEVARARNLNVGDVGPSPARRTAVLRVAPISGVGRRVVEEVRHVVADSPRAILIRLVVTLGISLSLVSFHHFSGLTKYDDVGQLTLYVFSAVVGSVVCTNALCFEAGRVRDRMMRGERIWRILVAKNLAMAVLVTVAALPVIAFLTVTNDGNPIAMVDQLVTMVFIWLGVGNVLSVLYPIRHEPISARLRDGTWKPYLFSFALSFVLVLASAVTSWVLLTVFAVACSREPRIRRILSREMVAHRPAAVR
jgi:hypothetical protein